MTRRRWLRLTLEAPSPLLDTLVDALLERGVLGSWQHENRAHLYFPPEFNPVEARAAVRFLLRIFGEEEESVHCEIGWEEERDWNDAWKRHYRPVPIGDQILVKAPWHDVPAAARGRSVVIEIEPGMAFGTGTHPSTQLTLRALERLVIPGASVLDVGTGSGILAIAAAKLGCRLAVGFDVDPESVRNAVVNVRRNGVGSSVRLFVGTIDAVAPRPVWDLIAANIQRTILLGLLNDFAVRVRKGGWLVLAGLLETEKAEMSSELARRGFHVVHVLELDEWIAIVAQLG